MIAVRGPRIPDIWVPQVFAFERVDLLPLAYLAVVGLGFVYFDHRLKPGDNLSWCFGVAVQDGLQDTRLIEMCDVVVQRRKEDVESFMVLPFYEELKHVVKMSALPARASAPKSLQHLVIFLDYASFQGVHFEVEEGGWVFDDTWRLVWLKVRVALISAWHHAQLLVFEEEDGAAVSLQS